jgi:hypothetical protein
MFESSGYWLREHCRVLTHRALQISESLWGKKVCTSTEVGTNRPWRQRTERAEVCHGLNGVTVTVTCGAVSPHLRPPLCLTGRSAHGGTYPSLYREMASLASHQVILQYTHIEKVKKS